jgi:hypothetical protein
MENETRWSWSKRAQPRLEQLSRAGCRSQAGRGKVFFTLFHNASMLYVNYKTRTVGTDGQRTVDCDTVVTRQDYSNLGGKAGYGYPSRVEVSQSRLGFNR